MSPPLLGFSQSNSRRPHLYKCAPLRCNLLSCNAGHNETNRITQAREEPIRALHCCASGRDGDWEAICLDLDIAVQGQVVRRGASLAARGRRRCISKPSPRSQKTSKSSAASRRTDRREAVGCVERSETHHIRDADRLRCAPHRAFGAIRCAHWRPTSFCYDVIPSAGWVDAEKLRVVVCDFVQLALELDQFLAEIKNKSSMGTM